MNPNFSPEDYDFSDDENKDYSYLDEISEDSHFGGGNSFLPFIFSPLISGSNTFTSSPNTLISGPNTMNTFNANALGSTNALGFNTTIFDSNNSNNLFNNPIFNTGNPLRDILRMIIFNRLQSGGQVPQDEQERNNFMNSLDNFVNLMLLTSLGSRSNLSDDEMNHLDQLFQNFQKDGKEPAKEEAIEKLSYLSIDKYLETHKDDNCAVCQSALSDFEDLPVIEKDNKDEKSSTSTISNEICMMPCNHHFHKNCVVQWLKLHNQCPVCRHEI